MANNTKQKDDSSGYGDNSTDDESTEKDYESGYDDDGIKSALLLIGLNNSDKNNRDNQNLVVNDIMKEASFVGDVSKPRYIGAKKAKQAVTKTAERIQMPKWNLQGDGADEIEEILMTKALKEILHRANYDWTFSGPNGIIDGILRYGDKYRMIQPSDKTLTSIPFKFENLDGNNIWMSVSATSFRHGNKIVTQIVALFRGSRREFKERFPQYADVDVSGLIPREFSYKDLDQTSSQKFSQQQTAGLASGANEEDIEDTEDVEWMYTFDISKLCYRFAVGADLKILEKKDGRKGKNKYPWIFTNIDGKQQPYFPVSNYMCLPSEEGIYHMGIVAYIFDMTIVFRRLINQIVGHVEENTYPHTLINIPQGQEGAFFNLVEMADLARETGHTAYIPITYNSNTPAGNVSSAAPILNGGDINQAKELMEILHNELRQCGIYLDEPLSSDLTEMQIQLNASNSSVLPKAIMKYNAPEIEFEVMVAIDMCKKYIPDNDNTPLILDTELELPDIKVSTRGIPYTLGWFKRELVKRAWRVRIDPNDGAVLNDNALIMLYKSILPSMQPNTPQYEALSDKILLLSGISTKSPSPAPAQQVPGGQPNGGGGASIDVNAPPIPGGQPNAPKITGEIAPSPQLQEAAGVAG